VLTEPALPARPWPVEREQALADLRHAGCTVLVLHYPAPPRRELARSHARKALAQCLCSFFQCDAADVALDAEAGHAPELAVRGQAKFVSFSHEPRISLVAIDTQGPVGVDVFSLEDPTLSAQESTLLARDYLPPDVATRIATAPEPSRPTAFAHAWAQHEATLKCHGKSLDEWQDAIYALYQNTPCQRVDTGPAYIAVCARRARA